MRVRSACLETCFDPLCCADSANGTEGSTDGYALTPFANFSRLLLLGGEHTWGSDVKTALNSQYGPLRYLFCPLSRIIEVFLHLELDNTTPSSSFGFRFSSRTVKGVLFVWCFLPHTLGVVALNFVHCRRAWCFGARRRCRPPAGRGGLRRLLRLERRVLRGRRERRPGERRRGSLRVPSFLVARAEGVGAGCGLGGPPRSVAASRRREGRLARRRAKALACRRQPRGQQWRPKSWHRRQGGRQVRVG